MLRLRTSLFANLEAHWWVWGFLDGISGPIDELCKNCLWGLHRWMWGWSADFGVHRQTLPYAKKMRVFFGGRGNIDELPEKLATQCKSKKKLTYTFVTWSRHWPHWPHEQKGCKEWTVWGGIYKAVEELTLTNLRTKRWAMFPAKLSTVDLFARMTSTNLFQESLKNFWKAVATYRQEQIVHEPCFEK